MSEDHLYCAKYQRAMELIGGRWTGSIIRALLGGAHQFGELRATIPGLSDRMLSARLRELEAEGLVRREVLPETPVRIRYELTDKGRALVPVIESVITWMSTWDNPAPLDIEASER